MKSRRLSRTLCTRWRYQADNTDFWPLAKYLVDFINDRTTLISTIMISPRQHPLALIPIATLGTAVHALDYLLPRLDPESLATLAVAALGPPEFSTALALHWHLNPFSDITYREHAPAGAILLASDFLSRFIIAAHSRLIALHPAPTPTRLFETLGQLLDLFRWDRLVHLLTLQSGPILSLLATPESAIDLIYGISNTRLKLPGKDKWNEEVALNFFLEPEVRVNNSECTVCRHALQRGWMGPPAPRSGAREFGWFFGGWNGG